MDKFAPEYIANLTAFQGPALRAAGSVYAVIIIIFVVRWWIENGRGFEVAVAPADRAFYADAAVRSAFMVSFAVIAITVALWPWLYWLNGSIESFFQALDPQAVRTSIFIHYGESIVAHLAAAVSTIFLNVFLFVVALVVVMPVSLMFCATCIGPFLLVHQLKKDYL